MCLRLMLQISNTSVTTGYYSKKNTSVQLIEKHFLITIQFITEMQVTVYKKYCNKIHTYKTYSATI